MTVEQVYILDDQTVHPSTSALENLLSKKGFKTARITLDELKTAANLFADSTVAIPDSIENIKNVIATVNASGLKTLAYGTGDKPYQELQGIHYIKVGPYQPHADNVLEGLENAVPVSNVHVQRAHTSVATAPVVGR